MKVFEILKKVLKEKEGREVILIFIVSSRKIARFSARISWSKIVPTWMRVLGVLHYTINQNEINNCNIIGLILYLFALLEYRPGLEG